MVKDNPKTNRNVILALAVVATYMVGSLVWDRIKDVTTLPDRYFIFPNQGVTNTSAPTKIQIYRANTRVWIGGNERIKSRQSRPDAEPRDKYERGYLVERLSDSRILVEIPKYPLTLESTPPKSVDPSSQGRVGTYYDYDGPESDELEKRLTELIPLGLDKADDGLELSIWDDDGIKSVTVEEVDKDLNPIRVVPQIYDYQDSPEYRDNFRQLPNFRELVAQRHYKIGAQLSFSVPGSPIPEERELRFGYDKMGIGDASFLKVTVVDSLDNLDSIYLDLRKK